MVLCASTDVRNAERVKRALREKGLFREGYRYQKENGRICFPVTKRSRMKGVTFVERDLERVAKKHGLKEVLAGELTAAELERLKTAYDVLGSIAIIEVDDGLRSKERAIAEAVLATHKSVKTVLKKLGGHEGELRLQRYGLLAGDDTRKTIVRENGVRLKIDVEQVYYSIRSATERKRVASLVKKGERVLVMFSGAAPYVCVIAKNSNAKEIVGIELNEKGHELGLENLRLNKLKNTVLIQGDVRDVIPELHEKEVLFDRIVMPLPHTGHDFLDEAFLVAKEGTVIHLYDFEQEDEFEKAAEKARAGAARNKRRIEVLNITPSGQHSPRVYRVCCNFKVL